MQPLIREGPPPRQILSYARETKVDLIVLAADHSPFPGASFLGRTTELALRYAPVPVLATPYFSLSKETEG